MVSKKAKLCNTLFLLTVPTILELKLAPLLLFNNFSDADLINSIDDIPVFFSKSSFFDSVFITKDHFHTKLTVSKSDSHKEPYYILTNGNTRDAT